MAEPIEPPQDPSRDPRVVANSTPMRTSSILGNVILLGALFVAAALGWFFSR